MSQTTPRERIFTAVLAAIISSPAYSRQTAECAEDEEFEALAHNTIEDAMTITDAALTKFNADHGHD